MAQYEGVITLQNVNDGAAGRGVSSIETKYYLGDNSTEHPSDTSSDWQDSLPTLEQGKYLWTQTKVSYTSGNPIYNYSISYVATDGTITTQYYTRIKYAEDNQGTNWSDTPTSATTYVGFYSGVEQSPAASQYIWSRYVGENGENGRGISNTVVEYNSSSNNTSAPINGWQSAIPSVAENSYLWTRTTITYTDNTTSISYTVAKQGAKGETGNAGKGISSTVIRYAVSDSGTVAPTGASNWKANLSDVTVNPGQFLWTRTVITYTDTTTSTSYSVAQYGETGAAGTSVSISSTVIQYGTSSNTTTEPTDWSTTQKDVSQYKGKYLWTKTIVNYSPSGSTTTYSKTYIGENGKDGKDGVDGTNGDDGRDVVVDTNNSFIKYIVSTNGTQHPSSTANWDTSFPASIPAGRFLWTWVHTAYKYSDGTSTNTSTDSYSVARQGEDGNKYYIKSNIDTIKRLFDVDNNEVEFLPSKFEFQVFDNDNSSAPLQTSLYNYTATLILLDSLESCPITAACTIAPENKVVLSIENLKQKLTELAYDVSLDVDDCQINFEVLYPKINGKVVAQYSVNIENGLEADFAKFKVNAANISANIANAGLVFSSEGLSINNGNFTINDENGNPLFIYDETVHKLIVTGNSYFSGQLDAAGGTFSGTLSGVDGDFTGKINANEGLIGGFSISQGQLISTDNNQSIQLNGADGSIIANNIKLGTGAEIDNYLKLGNAFIYNPGHEDRNRSRLFISAGNSNNDQGYLKIYDTGNIDLGNIKLQGQDSIINLKSSYVKTLDNIPKENKTYYEYDEEESDYKVFVPDDPNDPQFEEGIDYYEFIIPQITAGDNVRITPDRSIFKNVDITGTLHTSVFEVGKVQTAGGAMIFKEGAEIDTIVQNGNNYNFTTKTPINLAENSIVVFTKKDDSKTFIYGRITAANSNTSFTTTATIIDNTKFAYTNITQLADYKDGTYKNNLVIGINSGSNNEKEMLYPQALTMRTIIGYNNNEPIYTNKPTLVLGKLDGIIPSNSNIKDYGLYGENVYLTGSLTTETSTTSYAGVNTLNGVPAKIFDGITNLTSDNSKIVFWAGADESQYSTLDLAIQNAPFQVTEQGSFYAGQGYFIGAIITDADIYAAALHTADIYGTGTITSERKDVLKIHDTNSGIGFYNENDERQLNITNSGLGWGDNNQFIQIANNLINFTGNIFQGEIFKGNFEGNITTEKDINNKYIGFEGSTIQGRQLTDNGSILLGYLTLDTKTILSNNKEKIELDSGAVNITANITSMSKDVYFGNKMKYQQITDENNNIIGYDLYIS